MVCALLYLNPQYNEEPYNCLLTYGYNLFRSIKPLLPSYSLPFFHKRSWPWVCFFTHTHTHTHTHTRLSFKLLILLWKKNCIKVSLKVHFPDHERGRRGFNEIGFYSVFLSQIGRYKPQEKLVSWRVTNSGVH